MHLRDIIQAEYDLATVRRGLRSQANGKKSLIPHVMVGGVEKKSCSRCCSLFSLSEFRKDARTVDGLRTACKSCESGREKKRRQK
jgi:hypothetical protein